MLFVLCALLTISVAQTCNANRAWTCSLHANCLSYYEFEFNATTAQWITSPRNCKYAASGLCTSGASCEPSCFVENIKTGGPDGKICADFTNIADCRKYYADNNGDRWCYWSYATNSCKEESRTCHN